MNHEDLDLVQWRPFSAAFAQGSFNPPTTGLVNQFIRGIFEARVSGLFLMIVRWSPSNVPGTGAAYDYNGYLTKNLLTMEVRDAAGTIKGSRVFPPSATFECSSLHTHTCEEDDVFQTDGVNSSGTYTGSYRTADPMNFYAFVFLHRLDRLIVYRDFVPDTDVNIQLIRMASTYMNTQVAEI